MATLEIKKIKKFSLKEKDFLTGKMVSPSRSEWKTCDCCGRKIVQGVMLDNGHLLGNECETVRERIEFSMYLPEEKAMEQIGKMFKIFGTEKRVQDYMTNFIK